MANYRLKQSGNIATLANWQDDSSGVFADSTVLPTSLDNVYANGFTGDITANFTANIISSRSATGISVGGYFEVKASCTVVALFKFIGRNISASPLDTTKCTILINTNSITVYIIGEQEVLTGYSSVICINSNATVYINGNGNSLGTGGCSVWNTSSANLSIVEIEGNYTSTSGNSAASYAIYNQGEFAKIKHTGIRTGGASPNAGSIAFRSEGASAEIELIGEDIRLGIGVASSLSAFGTLKINTLIDGYNGAINITATNKTFTLTGSIRGITGVAITTAANTTMIMDGLVQFYSNGISPINTTLTYILPNINNKICFEHPTTMQEICLFSELNQPIEADVRDGVSYVNRIGTLKIPPPTTVLLGVPTDDTVGTWAFDSALISRLENVVTEEILVTQLGNLNFD